MGHVTWPQHKSINLLSMIWSWGKDNFANFCVWMSHWESSDVSQWMSDVYFLVDSTVESSGVTNCIISTPYPRPPSLEKILWIFDCALLLLIIIYYYTVIYYYIKYSTLTSVRWTMVTRRNWSPSIWQPFVSQLIFQPIEPYWYTIYRISYTVYLLNCIKLAERSRYLLECAWS